MVRVNRRKAVVFEVEVTTQGGKPGDSSFSGAHSTEAGALRAMAKGEALGGGAVCTARNDKGEGRIFLLGLIPGMTTN